MNVTRQNPPNAGRQVLFPDGVVLVADLEGETRHLATVKSLVSDQEVHATSAGFGGGPTPVFGPTNEGHCGDS